MYRVERQVSVIETRFAESILYLTYVYLSTYEGHQVPI